MKFRSLIYVPGSDPHKIRNTLIFDADIIVFDLEDSVAIRDKEDARILVKHAILSLPFNKRIYVRINGFETPFFEEDIQELIDTNIEGFRIPKISTNNQLKEIVSIISKYEQQTNLAKKKLILTIEDAKGIVKLDELENIENRIVALSPGFADICNNIGCDLSEFTIKDYIRFKILIAARNMNVAAIDGIYSNIDDMEGLKNDCERAKKYGFDGKSAIHPNQLEIINQTFNPFYKEIDEAINIIKMYERLGRPGAFSYQGKMIDKPFVEKCYKIINEKEAKGSVNFENL